VDVAADWWTLAEANRLCDIRAAIGNAVIIIIVIVIIWRGEEEF
jgi:hypothetical protein